MADKREHLRSIILSALNKGELKVGSKLPKESELTQQYGMSRATVREGIATLVQDGILARKRRAGTFVSRLKAMPKSKSIAAMVCWVRGLSDRFDQLMWTMEEQAHERGFSLVLCNHDNDEAKMVRYVDRLAEDGVAGVIFGPSQFPRLKETNLKIVSLLEEKGIPFVLLAAIFRESANRYSFVGSNGFSAIREVVRHLVGVGHCRIAYIRSFIGNFSSDERYLGFLEQMKQEGLEVPARYVKAIQEVPMEEQARREIREILSETPRPTAVICTHDGLAKNVMDELKKLGLKVPEDIGVVGFDDLYFAKTLDPPLTTVRVPDEEGKHAADLLFAKINGELTGERQEFLPCKLIVRRSCGAKISSSSIVDEPLNENKNLLPQTLGSLS
jgi:GntR family transcriptional regulator, arabinose operon transcriptional repressor